MPGSTSNPVRLDHYQNIIEVGWSSIPYYLSIRTRLRQNIVLESSFLGWGDYSGVGVAAPPGSYIASYYDILTRAYSSGFETDKYSLVDVFSRDGQLMSFPENELISLAGAAELPLSIIPGDGYSSGVAPTFGPIVGSSPQMRWATVAGSLPVPVAGAWMDGRAVSEITAFPFTAGPDEYNPDFPTPKPLYAVTRPVSGLAVVIDSLDVTPSSVSLAAFPGETFVPIGVILVDPDPPDSLFFTATVLCERQ